MVPQEAGRRRVGRAPDVSRLWPSSKGRTGSSVSLPPYRCLIALAQIRRATLPITAHSASTLRQRIDLEMKTLLNGDDPSVGDRRVVTEEDQMSEELVGVVDHWYGDMSVAGVRVTAGSLSVGDKIHIKGHTTDLTTTIGSMQIEHEVVSDAAVGDQVGIKVTDRVRMGDQVFRLSDG